MHFCGAAFVLLALGAVVEVTHQVHDLAFDGLGLSRWAFLGAQTQRRQRQAGAERQGHHRCLQYHSIFHCLSFPLFMVTVRCNDNTPDLANCQSFAQ